MTLQEIRADEVKSRLAREKDRQAQSPLSFEQKRAQAQRSLAAPLYGSPWLPVPLKKIEVKRPRLKTVRPSRHSDRWRLQ